jgi:hypothetical protein
MIGGTKGMDKTTGSLRLPQTYDLVHHFVYPVPAGAYHIGAGQRGINIQTRRTSRHDVFMPSGVYRLLITALSKSYGTGLPVDIFY